MDCYIICPDLHLPYENRPATRLMMEAVKDLKPVEFIQLGDFADFYTVSSHPKSPKVCDKILMQEVSYCHAWLEEFNKVFPYLKKTITLGNHENRLERYIQNKAPELFGLTDSSSILKLKEFGWKVVPYSKNQLYRVGKSDVYCRHEPLSNSSAKASMNNSHISLVYGHTHRKEVYETRDFVGNKKFQLSSGFMGDRTQKSIFGYAVDRKNVGFTVLYIKGDKVHYNIIDIDDKNNEMILNGYLYKFKKGKISKVRL